MIATASEGSPAEPARTLFLGSGTFAVPVLDRLATLPGVRLVGVVTAPPRPAGRGAEPRPTPIAMLAERLGLATLTPARLRDDSAYAALAALRPGLIVLADYGRLVPQAVLDLPRHGALNLHPSLLPRHRGASPIPAAILAGDRETGVTLMRMDAGLDTGPIVAQRKVPLQHDEEAPALEARLADLSSDLLADALPDWLAGGLREVPQPIGGATLTRPLRREDGRMDPGRSAAELARQVRAYLPWPGSYVELDGERLVVWKASTSEAPADRAARGPGPIVALGDGVALVTEDGLLELLEVQPAGGRRMTGPAWRRGRPALVGPSWSARTASPSRAHPGVAG